MRWSAILASLKHSHSTSLSFASFCPQRNFSYQSSVLGISRSSLFRQTGRSTSQESALLKSSNGSTSRVTVRAATTIAESGKDSSALHGKASDNSKERLSGERPSTKGKSTRSLSKKNATLPASPAVQRDFKEAPAKDESPHICRDKNNGTKSSKSKANLKARSYESFVDASVAILKPKGRSRGQVLSGDKFFEGVSKEGNIFKRPARSLESSKEESIALASIDSSEPRLDCLSEAEFTPGRFDEVGDNAGNKLKDSFLRISFPVTIFAEWWFYCFLRGYRPYPETLHCLGKLYFWLGAYQRAHRDATGNFVHGHCVTALERDLGDLQKAVLSKSFRWGDTKHIYLRCPLGPPKRSLSLLCDVDTTFSFQDRVVQEVLYLILEPIFEARFSTRSHASRPSRGPHTALRAAQRSFIGCSWIISGDLTVLQEGAYASCLMDSVLKVVKDARVTYLLRYPFERHKSGKVEHIGMRSSFLSAAQGSCERLKHLLCNVLLDPFDWWMEEQIGNLTKQEPLRTLVTRPSGQGSKMLLSKPWRHPCKLEYVRYGTKFWMGCIGTMEEVNSLKKGIYSFMNMKFDNCFECKLAINHISTGVNILDHVISPKIVRPIYKRRRASSGRLFEKRALRIKLCVKASIESCINNLKQLGVPASLQHIEEVLSVLDCWYHCAENKGKVLMYCKTALCHMYSMKGSIEKGEESRDVKVAEQLKQAVGTVVPLKTERGHSSCDKSFIRIPEHELVFREHAWLQSRAMTPQLKNDFKNMRKSSPQQNMTQVLWQYLGAADGDNGWDRVLEMQTSGPEQGSVGEELAESAG
ncbi:hypothetical protein L7F22_066921 [Adiantum nelumboides]|nr:hypothetical protein [Adiantum nelumboides]